MKKNNSVNKKELKDMNIVHINVEAPFMEDSGYQETVLAKCHKILCNKVTIINNNHVLASDGSISRCEPKVYYNSDNVKIIRMNLFDENNKRHVDIKGLYEILLEENPDFIMIHEVLCFDVLAVSKYIKRNNPQCIVIADSHATIDNSSIINNDLKNILFRLLIKSFNRYMSRYYKRVYGIIEDSVDLMVNYAGIPRKKTDVIELGYDETLIDYSHRDRIREEIRERYAIPHSSFLIAHGGKLNPGKKTEELLEVLSELDNDIHIIIFGEFSDSEYESIVVGKTQKIKERVRFTGMLSQSDIYNVYLAADCAVFPGTASCLRQQAVASGIPVVVGYCEADAGINILVNNNAILLKKDWNKKDLLSGIEEIYRDEEYSQNAKALINGEYRKYSYLYQAEQLIKSNMEMEI